uniref:Protein kinase domain-containing protein n=1 Tax=Macrostomum lignano TaxID=282301 RepID=A0A1I8JP79_9PLAT
SLGGGCRASISSLNFPPTDTVGPGLRRVVFPPSQPPAIIAFACGDACAEVDFDIARCHFRRLCPAKLPPRRQRRCADLPAYCVWPKLRPRAGPCPSRCWPAPATLADSSHPGLFAGAEPAAEIRRQASSRRALADRGGGFRSAGRLAARRPPCRHPTVGLTRPTRRRRVVEFAVKLAGRLPTPPGPAGLCCHGQTVSGPAAELIRVGRSLMAARKEAARRRRRRHAAGRQLQVGFLPRDVQPSSCGCRVVLALARLALSPSGCQQSSERQTQHRQLLPAARHRRSRQLLAGWRARAGVALDIVVPEQHLAGRVHHAVGALVLACARLMLAMTNEPVIFHDCGGGARMVPLTRITQLLSPQDDGANRHLFGVLVAGEGRHGGIAGGKTRLGHLRVAQVRLEFVAAHELPDAAEVLVRINEVLHASAPAGAKRGVTLWKIPFLAGWSNIVSSARDKTRAGQAALNIVLCGGNTRIPECSGSPLPRIRNPDRTRIPNPDPNPDLNPNPTKSRMPLRNPDPERVRTHCLIVATSGTGSAGAALRHQQVRTPSCSAADYAGHKVQHQQLFQLQFWAPRAGPVEPGRIGLRQREQVFVGEGEHPVHHVDDGVAERVVDGFVHETGRHTRANRHEGLAAELRYIRLSLYRAIWTAPVENLMLLLRFIQVVNTAMSGAKWATSTLRNSSAELLSFCISELGILSQAASDGRKMLICNAGRRSAGKKVGRILSGADGQEDLVQHVEHPASPSLLLSATTTAALLTRDAGTSLVLSRALKPNAVRLVRVVQGCVAGANTRKQRMALQLPVVFICKPHSGVHQN